MPFDLSNYEPVEERIAKFWADHPEGRITTELLSSGDGEFIVRASVWRTDRDADYESKPAATGLAHEHVTDRGVNSTSALENCETSAIGRALANLGYAPKGARPSREEMAKVGQPAKDENLEWLSGQAQKFGLWTPEQMDKAWQRVWRSVKPGKPMTRAEAEEVLAGLEIDYEAMTNPSGELPLP